MPMVALNSASTFVAKMVELQIKWTKLAKERVIEGCGRKFIVDDMLVHGRDAEPLLQYSRAILGFLKYHQATINMKNCKWFHNHCKFVGVDVGDHGNSLAHSKYATFEWLERLNVCQPLHAHQGVCLLQQTPPAVQTTVDNMEERPCRTTPTRRVDSGGRARAYEVNLDGRVQRPNHQSQTGCTKRTGAVPPQPEVTLLHKKRLEQVWNGRCTPPGR